MIALGLCHVGNASRTSLPHRSVGRLAVLGEAVTGPRDLLELILSVAERLDAFLPFGPRNPPDFAWASSWVEERTSDLAPALDRLAGRAELLVTLSPRDCQVADTGTGRSWLQEKARRHEWRKHLETHMNLLAPDATPIPGSLDGPVEAAILMPPSEMRDRAHDLRSRCSGSLSCKISGPWPAFNFAAALRRSMSAAS